MGTKQTLIDAKDILKTRGRTRTDLLNRDGCACLLGAVGLAAGASEQDMRIGLYDIFREDGDAFPAVNALIGALPEDYLSYDGTEGMNYVDVYTFNDVHKDDEPVFDLLDRAIEAAE